MLVRVIASFSTILFFYFIFLEKLYKNCETDKGW